MLRELCIPRACITDNTRAKKKKRKKKSDSNDKIIFLHMEFFPIIISVDPSNKTGLIICVSVVSNKLLLSANRCLLAKFRLLFLI